MAEAAEAKRKRQIDWEACERDYRTGLTSLRELGRKYDVTATRICQKAKECNWQRDLSVRIRHKAELKLQRAEAEQRHIQLATAHSLNTEQMEAAVVDAVSDVIADVRRRHRALLGKARTQIYRMLEELEAMTGQATSGPLAERVLTMNRITSSLKDVVGLERQAFNLDGTPDLPADDRSAAVSAEDTARRVAFILASSDKALRQ